MLVLYILSIVCTEQFRLYYFRFSYGFGDHSGTSDLLLRCDNESCTKCKVHKALTLPIFCHVAQFCFLGLF